jgi:hypothetical protein
MTPRSQLSRGHLPDTLGVKVLAWPVWATPLQKRNTRAGVESLDRVLDLVALRSRVEELDARNATDADGAAIREFLEAWRRQDKNPHD